MALCMVREYSLILSLFLCSAFLISCTEKSNQRSEKPEQITLKVNVDAVGKMFQINSALAEEFEAQTGIKVELVAGPADATERLTQYLNFMGAKSEEFDILQVDVIWPGLLEPHLLDLSGKVEASEHFDALIDNNTVNGKLVAVPYYADAGLLYYRTDLLEKYGFESPPATWAELESMAKKVMEGERADGDPNFYGYVFQGAAYEGLTCNALEWQVSESGDNFINDDGQAILNSTANVEAFKRAKSWVGNISPVGITNAKEDESQKIFQQGNALFMRNWPYAWALGQEVNSPIKDQFSVGILPAGANGNASVLGGWQLAVSKYSKHPEEAIQFINFISTKEVQIRRALEGGYIATRPDVYEEQQIVDVVPYFAIMQDTLEAAVPRPANPAGRRYSEVSAAYYEAVHAILTSDQDPERILSEAEDKIQQVLER